MGAVLGGMLRRICSRLMEHGRRAVSVHAPHRRARPVLHHLRAGPGLRRAQGGGKLRSFRLEDAQCHSDDDREELQQLIAKWFTERRAGDDDTEDARRVGHHRFEQFVRHTVAPTLVSSRWHYLQLMLAIGIFSMAPIFDMMCSDAFNAHHVAGVTAMLASAFTLLVPMKLFIFWRSARVVVALRERCACPAALAYGVGVLLNTCFGILPLMFIFMVGGPTTIFDPAYRLPDDGLDSTGRKMLVTQLGVIFTAIGVCAVAWVFKL